MAAGLLLSCAVLREKVIATALARRIQTESAETRCWASSFSLRRTGVPANKFSLGPIPVFNPWNRFVSHSSFPAILLREGRLDLSRLTATKTLSNPQMIANIP